LLDVRAPVEFEKGAFPGVVNIPLLTNDERHEVGIRYKEQGQEAAIVLGNQLVTGDVKQQRLNEWTKFCQKNPDGYLYCFRGGLRSRTVQAWIQQETGMHYPLVEGGQKAMRNFLLEELERSLDVERTDILLIAGKTGVGKTRVINELADRSLDLEGLAHHRGSSFGGWPEEDFKGGQISQIDFENSVSIALLQLLDSYEDAAKKTSSSSSSQRFPLFVEDEGNRIGGVNIAPALRDRMKHSQGMVLVEESIEDRVQIILEDYVYDLDRRFRVMYGDEDGPDRHCAFMLACLRRIRNRLGSERHDELNTIMTAAFELQKKNRNDDADNLHREWILELLERYYDPMYEYQLEQRKDNVPILFRGTADEVVDWAKTQ
jgi:tRNA 2-selenouridine synthase